MISAQASHTPASSCLTLALNFYLLSIPAQLVPVLSSQPTKVLPYFKAVQTEIPSSKMFADFIYDLQNIMKMLGKF